MLRCAQICRSHAGHMVRGVAGLVAATSLLAAGCSSDITRFNYPASGLTESRPSGPPPRSYAEAPRPVAPMQGGGNYGPPPGAYGGYAPPPNPYGGYAPPPNQYGGYAPPSNQYGSYAPPPNQYGSYAPPPNQYGGYAPPANTYGGYAAPAGNYRASTPRPSSYGANTPPSGNQSSNIAVSALPRTDVAPRTAPAPASVAPPPARSSATAPAAAAPAGSAGGDVVEVQPGDTLYTLAKRHRVSMSELMRVNQITDPSLKPGQKLRLPAGARAVAKALPRQEPARPVAETPPMREPQVASAPATPAPAAPAPAAAAPAGWTDTYTIKPGDSLYGLARRRGVTVAELQRVNAISDVHKMQPGTVLKVPAESTDAKESAGEPAPVPAVAITARPASGVQPKVLNAPRVAALESKGSMSDAQPGAGPASASNAAKQEPAQGKAAPDSKLRWPVKGRIISAFGPRSDGTRNDGINLSVPQGTDVLAAESGVVAYAGSEVRGYGNLVLVRHENGWVTAYAHNDQLQVQRGDRVRRGQVLAKAGRTGNVDQPQLHFELRQGPKPVDPVPYMERM